MGRNVPSGQPPMRPASDMLWMAKQNSLFGFTSLYGAGTPNAEQVPSAWSPGWARQRMAAAASRVTGASGRKEPSV